MDGGDARSTEQVRHEVLDLVRRAAEHAKRALDVRADQPPFAASLDFDGEIHFKFLAPLPTDSPADCIDALFASLAHSAATLRAGIVLVSPGDDLLPVLRFEGEHRESAPFTALTFWKRNPVGQVEWVQTSVQAGARSSLFG